MTIDHDTTATLRVKLYQLQAELADVRVKLAGTEDRLADATENAQRWRELYHACTAATDPVPTCQVRTRSRLAANRFSRGGPLESSGIDGE